MMMILKLIKIINQEFFQMLARITNEKSDFSKVYLQSVIIESDKCPPWTIQSSKMLHDNKKDNIL